LGTELGDCKRVRYVGFATLAVLAQVGLIAKSISSAKLLTVFFRKVSPCEIDERAY
jgi:hypothetical protein